MISRKVLLQKMSPSGCPIQSESFMACRSVVKIDGGSSMQ